ncbi:glycoside hydrolase superfamily [Cladorrhinum sp. PSN332]|nr:glycoside hydrolase superfamily [Cladorrhinum sp. PSN332]
MENLITNPNDKTPWWKDAVFYQIYPASFKDSNNDGWGDIPGIISKIPYLARHLGVDAIWLSPIYQSPQNDMGYDVSDYQSIHPPYGTLADVEALISTCHAHNLKIILDLVINHTSSQHPWFLESRSSKTNTKRSWYIWKPPRSFTPSGDPLPPTNWRGYFASSTWTYDPLTREYYLHLYHSSQPDLNWDSPECRRAIYSDAIEFWLEKGIDGFRIDTVNKYSKNAAFPDAPVTIPDSETQPAPEMWCNGPRIHEYLREMRTEVLDKYDAVSVGELSNTPDPTRDVLPYVSAASKELDMAHEFSVIRLGTGKNIFEGKYFYSPFTLSTLKRLVEKWQTFIQGTDGWNTVFVENHDNGRAVSRFGCEDDSALELKQASAKCIALWQATLTGSLFLYQGQEMGASNMPRDWDVQREYKDVESQEFYKEALDSKDRERIKRTVEGLRILARDHARLPFQWDGSENAGFTGEGVKPWMRVHDGFRETNVERQLGREGSVLEFYRRILKLRREHRGLFVHGRFRLLDFGGEELFVYVKESENQEGRKALVVLNFTGSEQKAPDVEEALGGTSKRLLVNSWKPGEIWVPPDYHPRVIRGSGNDDASGGIFEGGVPLRYMQQLSMPVSCPIAQSTETTIARSSHPSGFIGGEGKKREKSGKVR